MALEKAFENELKRYLESIGCYAFGTPKQDMIKPIIGYWEKRWGGSQYTKSGLPDMHVVIKGISIELELKAPRGLPSALQLKNLDIVNQSESLGFLLVKDEKDATRLNEWVKNKYPQYSVECISFKKLCVILKNIIDN